MAWINKGMNKIKFLQITITPWLPTTSEFKELRIKVVANTKVYETSKVFDENHFESMFDILMDDANREIKRMAKNDP